MAPDIIPFRTVIPFWPRRTGVFLWSSFRRDDARRDFELAATFGLRHLHCSLIWPDFQPEPQRVAVQPMRSLEQVLDVAGEYGIDMWVALFPVRVGSLLCLPSWTLDQWTVGERTVYTGAGFSRQEPRNLFVDALLVQAQALLVREVVGEFAQHPAVVAWQLGDGMGAVSKPDARDQYDAWIDTLSSAAAERRGNPRLWTELSARDVVRTAAFDPCVPADHGLSTVVTPAWRPVWAHGSGTLWPVFLTAYVRSLTVLPTVIRATTEGENERDGCDSDQELQAVAEAGGGGYIGPPLIDQAPDLLRTDVYRRGAGQTARSLFSLDGTPRQSVNVWQTLDAEPPTVAALPADFPRPDSERRLYSPEDVAFEAFEAFIR